MGTSKEEIRASLEIDFSQVRDRLRQADQLQQEQDKKSDKIQRRAKEIREEVEKAEASVRKIEHKIEHRLLHTGKELGKEAAAAIVFDTLTQFSDSTPGWAKGISEIVSSGLTAAAFSGNPIVGAVAALAKTIEVLKDAQREYQKEIEDLRKEFEKAEVEAEQLRAEDRAEREKREFELFQKLAELDTKISAEVDELMTKTWQMTAGGE